MSVNTSGANSLESEIARSYNSFSGSDITGLIGNIKFAEMQAISYSVTREKAPVYTMGSPDPRAFSRNKRGVAGSLVWIDFDRHALLNTIYLQSGTFVSNTDEIRPEYTPAAGQILGQSAIFSSTLVNPSGIPIAASINSFDVPIQAVSG